MLNVLRTIQQHPETMREVLLVSSSVKWDATTFDALFEIKLSEVGSNRRQDENKALLFWRDMLQDIEGRMLG